MRKIIQKNCNLVIHLVLKNMFINHKKNQQPICILGTVFMVTLLQMIGEKVIWRVFLVGRSIAMQCF